MEETNLQAATCAPKSIRNTAVRILFALFSVLMAYQFLGMIPIENVPLGTLLFAVLLFGGTLAYGLLIGAKPKADAILCLICGLIFASYPLQTGFSNEFPYYPCFLLTLAAYAYFVYTLFGNRKAQLPGSGMLLEWLQATVLYPFESFPALFITFFARRSEDKKGRWKPYLYTGIGIALALLFGCGVIWLLSFDAHFAAVAESIRKFFTVDEDWLFTTGLKWFFAIPFGALMFGIAISSERHRHPGFASAKTGSHIAEKLHFLPFVIAALPTATLILIYGLFFFSQMPYYLSAFSHVLPEAYSAADYARSGFFELCGVAAINAMLAFALNVFSMHTKKVSDALRKILIVLLSVETLILIATALSKMFLYIERFDLTMTRLWSTFFLGFVAVGFLCLLTSMFFQKLRVLPVVLTLGLLFAVVYPFCNVNRLIAQYNVDSYFRRVQTETEKPKIDTDYLATLGEAAVPELFRLYESDRTDSETRKNADAAIAVLARTHQWDPIRQEEAEPAWYQYSLHTAQAHKLLAQYHAQSALSDP